jgi:CRISPR-associated protein Cas1
VLKGRLGLETARIPHADRHGLLWLARGRLYVESGTLRFVTTGGDLPPGDYAVPFQGVSVLLIAPGTTVSHDALRLLARHGTGLVAVGEDGVRFYASMPFGPDDSALARRQVRLWADSDCRIDVAQHMYASRLGENLGQRDLNALRGIEGARMKESYRQAAARFGVTWRGRDYDRQNPQWNDDPNQAINYASTTVQAAAMVATAAAGAIPQLGFIHEDSGVSFCLDIADLYRDEVTLPVAFGAVAEVRRQKGPNLERAVRRLAGRTFREQKLIPKMIDRIKELLGEHDRGGDA